MFNQNSITFPVTVEEFTALQEKAAGRKGTADERELWECIADIANTAYFAILGGRPDAVGAMLTDLDNVLTDNNDGERIKTAFKVWMQLAVKQAISELPDHVAGGPLPN